jgi:hypothetical protein
MYLSKVNQVTVENAKHTGIMKSNYQKVYKQKIPGYFNTAILQ